MTQHCTRSGLQMAVINILLALVSAPVSARSVPGVPALLSRSKLVLEKVPSECS